MTQSPSRSLRFGYIRVSTTDQNPQLQHDALNQAGCDQLFVDHASGKTEDRPGLDALLSQLRAGDTVIAVLTLSLLAGAPIVQAANLANIAAGLVVRKLGVATVTADDLRRSLLRA